MIKLRRVKIAQFLELYNITQAQFAEKILGYNATYFSAILNGKRDLTLDVIEAIIRGTRIQNLDSLFYYDEAEDHRVDKFFPKQSKPKNNMPKYNGFMPYNPDSEIGRIRQEDAENQARPEGMTYRGWHEKTRKWKHANLAHAEKV